MSLSCLLFPGGFQPPILSSNRENWRIVCRAKVASLKSIASVDSRRVASRTVTYRARINPRRRAIYPRSCASRFLLSHTDTFFLPLPPPTVPPFDPSRATRCHASRCARTQHGSAEQSEYNERETFREWARWSKGQLMVRQWKNVIVSHRACACATRDNSYNKLHLRDKAAGNGTGRLP